MRKWSHKEMLCPSKTIQSSKIGNRPFVLWIGLIAPLKKPLDVIKIAVSIPEMDFVMLGSPWDKSLADKLMKESPSNLFYLGAVPNKLKKELIQKCSVGITTSIYEGFGWTPFEFLIQSKPFLAYPLDVFKEVYDDLLIYSTNTDDFVRNLKDLYRKSFQIDINVKAVTELQTKYDLQKAGSRIATRFGKKSLTILTCDIPIESNIIAGFLLVEWQLWRTIKDTIADTRIIANGRKFSEQFGLIKETTVVGQGVLTVKKKIGLFNQTTKPFKKVEKKILSLLLLFYEPLSFVSTFVKRMKAINSQLIITAGESQLFAGIMLKLFFRKKLVCLIHDSRFYYFIWDKKIPILTRAYYLIFTYGLRYVDCILVVSKKTMKELSMFYPFKDRIVVIWD